MEEKIGQIIARFARRLRFDPEAVREANRKQAMVPAGATALDPAGTAPGLVVPADGQVVIVLPGPPRELQEMWPRALEAPAAKGVLDRARALPDHVDPDVRHPRVRARQGPEGGRGRRCGPGPAGGHDLPERERAGHRRPPPAGLRGCGGGAARGPGGAPRQVHLHGDRGVDRGGRLPPPRGPHYRRRGVRERWTCWPAASPSGPGPRNGSAAVSSPIRTSPRAISSGSIRG